MDDGTSSQHSSNTSSEAPAILPGAVHDQLEMVLKTASVKSTPKYPSTRSTAPFSSSNVSKGKLSWNGNSPGTTATKTTTITSSSSTMQSLLGFRFGGGGRPRHSRRTVEDRRRELQQALENHRPVSHVKRTEWYVCPKTGLYKKKIVIVATKAAK